MSILFPYGLLRHRRRLRKRLVKSHQTLLEIIHAVFRDLNHVVGPCGQVHRVPGQSDTRGRDLTLLVHEERFGLKQRQLAEIEGQMRSLNRGPLFEVVVLRSGLLIIEVDKKQLGRGRQFEVQHFEDQLLHPQNLFLRVRVVRDVDELAEVGRVNFLVLGRDEHAGRTDQLQLGPLDAHDAEKAIDVVDGQVDGLVLEFVFLADLYEPVDEDGTHCERDVRLLRHVVPLCHVPRLVIQQVLKRMRR